MNNTFHKIVWAVCFLVLAMPEPGLTQHDKLYDLELFNMGGSFRLQLTCDAPVSYINKYDEFQNRLTLFFRNTEVALPQRQWRFEDGLIRKITAVDWHENLPMAKIDIYFASKVSYQIKKSIAGVVLVDVAQRHSEGQGINGTDNGYTVASVVEPGNKRADVDRLSGSSDTARQPSFLKSQSLSGAATRNTPDALHNSSPISLDVRVAEISDVLRLLSKQSGLNIVASNEVSGNVTVSLHDVTVREALDMIVNANGLNYSFHGDVVLVKPRGKFEALELETKVYRLRYLDANNLKASVAQVLSPEAKVQVFYSSYQSSTATGGEDEQVSQKNRSSTLIVTDSPSNLRQLDAMIEALDVPTPQIMIEAKLIEISPQNETRLGINWDKSINAEIFREILLPSGQPFQYSAEIATEGGGVNYGTLSIERFNTVLNFLNSKTNSKLVSNPRIMAMDNEEALISVGTTFPIPQINRGVGGQGDVVTFEYRDVNIELRVTPHVGENESITLLVKPQVEEVIGEVQAGDNSAPITSKRSVETIVNLKNNETMVIGGLIRENTVDIVHKVWLLGDIPLIGNLFRNKQTTKRQTDLLIFITPRLVGPLN